MARARNIKPGFFKNEDLAECSMAARLCFAGLWTLADREGRLEDRPKRIKAELFAFDSIEVEPLLRELEAHKFILRYDADALHAIQILRFSEHQTPHYSEKPSVIKPPTLQESPPIKPPDSGNTPGVGTSLRGGRNPLNPESGFLNPESLIPPTPNGVRRRHPKTDKPPEGFLEFYARYPRKVARAAAEKAWSTISPDETLRGRIMSALESNGFDRRDNGRFIPHPATWLNAARWDDEPVLELAATAEQVNRV